jgi:hypothetical protein
MSILHVNQIDGALHRLFDSKIDLSDVQPATPAGTKAFLTRALAAFAIMQLVGISADDAALAVTDGTGDNGIDALHYDRLTKTMFVVQAKWHSDGNGAFDRADMLKFTKGFEDLAEQELARFNAKVNAKADMIKEALHDDKAKYVLVPIHTGTNDLAPEVQQDLDDCLAKYNDTMDTQASDLLEVRLLKQGDVHALVARGTQGDPIDLEVALFQWGEAVDPYSVYGQVAASDVASWWKDHYPQIVSQNIRMFLGADTEVNAGLQTTLLNDPKHFWHFNNGVTVICREISPKMVGGKSKEAGYFNCYDVRIVNGAQTAGSIASAHDKKKDAVEQARVQVRFIAVGNGQEALLGDEITKATNTQNRINPKDFVSLDPEQNRLRTELMIEGVFYNYKSGDGSIRDQKTTDIEEATVALACGSSGLSHSTLAKREIGRLWEDTTKPPYKALFNPSVSGLKLWQSVRILRLVENALSTKLAAVNGREEGFFIHGNRFIAHNVFQRLPAAIVNGSTPLQAKIAVDVAKLVDDIYNSLSAEANKLYSQAYLAQLFKNQQKLTAISKAMASKP